MRGLALAAAAAVLLAVSVTPPVSAAAPAVVFVSLPAVHPGKPATAAVRAPAGARCTIRVVYWTGPATAKGLGPKTVPSSGTVVWRWTVGRKTTRGAWPVTVTCTKGSWSGSAVKKLVVR